MIILANIIGIILLSVIAYWGANTFFKTRMSEALMEDAEPYRLPSFDYKKTLLILGDSTGAGVGAERPEESVGGRLAARVAATYVENYAEPGAMVEDLEDQIQKAKLPEYDLILVQIGGNDILAFHNAKRTAVTLSEAFGKLPRAGKLYLMCAGNMGGATLFPPPMRPFHTMLNRAFHKEFERVAHGWHATYINLYDPFFKDPFLRDPQRYLSRDGLHPSSYGYGLWFDKLAAHLE